MFFWQDGAHMTAFDHPLKRFRQSRTRYGSMTVFVIIALWPEPPVYFRQSPGLNQRVANTTLQFPATPPSLGYTATNLFPNISFNQPVGIASPPGETNRLFILEKPGTSS